MDTAEPHDPWIELARVAAEGSAGQLESFLEQLPPNDVALALSRLSEEDQTRILTTLSAADAAHVVEQLPAVQATELIEHLEPHSAAAILDELPSNDQADLINELSEGDAEAILDALDPAVAAEVRALASYAADTAGGMMVTEFLTFAIDSTADDVIRDLRENADQYSDYDIQYAYVSDRDGRLRGVLRLRDLLLSPRVKRVSELMIADPLSVHHATTLDELAEFFSRHHFLGVPVVDDQQRLIGVVRKAAVDEAQSDRDRSNFLKTQGIVSGEEIRAMPLLVRSRGRLAWLSVNILLNIVAASVIAAYQDTLSAVIALAVFLPIISDMSGCSGNQAVAVSLRELSLGLVRSDEVWRVWLKEIAVGVLNGLVLGVLIGAVAWLWKGNIYLGLVVGVALCANTMVAVSIGGVVPLIVKRLGMDPAIASGPILTTVTDMCGFFLVLGTATLALSQLTI